MCAIQDRIEVPPIGIGDVIPREHVGGWEANVMIITKNVCSEQGFKNFQFLFVENRFESYFHKSIKGFSIRITEIVYESFFLT